MAKSSLDQLLCYSQVFSAVASNRCHEQSAFNMSTQQTIEAVPQFVRRLGLDPHANGAQTASLEGCPDIFELSDGNFAVIGVDITQFAGNLPPTAGCGPDERIVRIPRNLLIGAKADIPDRT